MAKLEILLTDHALSDLKGFPEENRQQIHQDLMTLASSPSPGGNRIKRLKGFKPPLYRLRCGDFRVLYRHEGDTLTVLRVIDRKVLDRIAKRLRG